MGKSVTVTNMTRGELFQSAFSLERQEIGGYQVHNAETLAHAAVSMWQRTLKTLRSHWGNSTKTELLGLRCLSGTAADTCSHKKGQI